MVQYGKKKRPFRRTRWSPAPHWVHYTERIHTLWFLFEWISVVGTTSSTSVCPRPFPTPDHTVDRFRADSIELEEQ